MLLQPLMNGVMSVGVMIVFPVSLGGLLAAGVLELGCLANPGRSASTTLQVSAATFLVLALLTTPLLLGFPEVTVLAGGLVLAPELVGAILGGLLALLAAWALGVEGTGWWTWACAVVAASATLLIAQVGLPRILPNVDLTFGGLPLAIALVSGLVGALAGATAASRGSAAQPAVYASEPSDSSGFSATQAE
jgi:hypothetical protein